MLTRKSQYGWMVVGGLLCLSGLVVVLKLREGNPVMAQPEPPPGPQAIGPDAPPLPPLPPGAAVVQMKLPGEPLPPPVSNEPAPPQPTIDQVTPLAPPLAPPTPPIGVDPSSLPPPPALIDPAPPSPPVHNVVNIQPPPAPLPSPAPPSLAPVEPAAPGPFPPPRPDPMKAAPPALIQTSQVGEPPLAGSGPIQSYQVHNNGETIREIARRTLGTGERWTEVYKLNPNLHPEDSLTAGTLVHLPPDACLPVEEIEGLKPLPAMRPKTAPIKPKTVLALTGTYPCNLDDRRMLTLPRAVREQFGDADLLLVSPGPDQCLWLTDQAHQERLAERLEHSPAREVDVRVFKRLYYAQTERVAIAAEGRVTLSDRLAQFAGLSQEVVLVGIDDHFEVWDAARWKQYTQVKSAAAVSGSE